MKKQDAKATATDKGYLQKFPCDGEDSVEGSLEIPHDGKDIGDGDDHSAVSSATNGWSCGQRQTDHCSPGRSKQLRGKECSKTTSSCRLFANFTCSKLKNVKNVIPALTRVFTQGDHIKVLISQVDIAIKSPTSAGRLCHVIMSPTGNMSVGLQAITGYQLQCTQTPHQGK